MKFCPNCGSKDIDWVLPQTWSKYECKDCGYIGVFIIEDGNLILSKCEYHKFLVNDTEKVQGGGWFRVDYVKKIFTFYGDSHEFGKATLEDIKKAVEDDKVYTNIYLTHSIVDKFKFLYDTGSELLELN